MSLFRTVGLAKRFGGIAALQGLSFVVNAGEVVCLIGPNGSGKSTALNIISGTTRADSGECYFNDRRTTSLPPHAIAELGIGRTFQNTTLFPTLTILENVEMAAYTGSRTSVIEAIASAPRIRRERRAARERAEHVLATIGGGQLHPRRFDYPYSCSLGEQRLIEIANILVRDPSFVLMDEPTQGLNPVWISQVLDVIQDMRGHGKTILFIEHKMSVVAKLADRVVVLDHGEKIAEGTFAEIRANPEVMRVYLGA